MQVIPTMRSVVAFVIALSATATIAIAQTFVIEGDDSFGRLPTAIKHAVIADKDGTWSKELFDQCPLFGARISLSKGGERSDFIVSTMGCGGGSAAFPVWLVSVSGMRPRVVLRDAAVMLRVKRGKSSGLRDVSLIRGSAGYCDETLMRFDGSQYVEYAERKCEW